MAFVTELLVVAAVAVLGVIQCFYRVDVDEIAAVAFGNVIPPEILCLEINTDSTPEMTIETVVLRMALGTVCSCLACEYPVTPHPIGLVIGAYTFAFVTIIALDNLHGSIFLVGLLLRSRLMGTESREKDQHRQQQPVSLHRCTPLSKNHNQG